MKKTLTTPSPCELVLTREYRAPRDIVFEAMTNPDCLREWLRGGPNDPTLVSSEKELRAGGAWRNVLRWPDGTLVELKGVYLEVVPNQWFEMTEDYGDFRGEMVLRIDLTECNGVTTAATTVRFASQAIRDEVLARGIANESDAIYSLLNEYVLQRSSARR